MIQNQQAGRRIDPFETERTLYNPVSGDLYISVTDKEGRVSRRTFNLLSNSR